MYVPARRKPSSFQRERNRFRALDRSGGFMQRRNLIRRLAVIALVTLTIAGCTTPNSLAALNDQLQQAADAMNDLRMNMGTLETSLDSLRIVVAKQDTTIGRLANAAGIPIAK
jgi:outer membrane lipoprotein SlyB